MICIIKSNQIRMQPIYFYGHTKATYPSSLAWKHVFSQWYYDKKPFCYMSDSPVDLAQYYPHLNYHEFMSNNELIFKTRENWMMFHKALLFAKNEYADYNKVIALSMLDMSPLDVKNMGRRVKGFYEETWNLAKYDIVVNGNYFQFTQNNELKEILLNTGDSELIEASPYDRVWGIGYSEKKAVTVPRSQWGENLLGRALMDVRNRIR